MAQFKNDTLAMRSADTICHAMEKKKNFLRALGLRMLPPGSSCLIPLTTGKLLAGSTGLKKQILAQTVC